MEKLFSYVCTGGRGTERFIADELLQKVHAQHVDVIQGKVFFESSASPSHLLHLKCVERLFVCIARLQPLNFSKKRRQLTGLLQETVASIPPDQWIRCARQWECFQSAAFDNGCHSQQTDVTSFAGLSAASNKKKMPAGEDLCTGLIGVHQGNPECPDDNSVPACSKLPLELCQTDFDGQKLSWDSNIGGQDSQDERAAVDENQGCDSRSLEKVVTFRMSCKCTGHAALVMSSQELSCVLGPIVSQYTGWSVKLKDPLLEVYVHCNNDQFVIGLPVTKFPLSRRSYLCHVGLRCPVAWIIATLADFKAGQVVLDPMCGAGTILIEAAVSFPDAVYVGLDNNHEQINRAVENVSFSQVANVIVMRGSVTDLPFPDNSIDAVVSDLPFGQKHLPNSSLEELYQLALKEMTRVVHHGGRAVLLTSPFSTAFLQKAIANCRSAQTTHCRTKTPVNPESRKEEMPDYKDPSTCSSDTDKLEAVCKDVSPQNTCGVRQLSDVCWIIKDSFSLGLGVRDAVIHVLGRL